MRRWWTAGPLLLTVRELQLLTELAHNAERVMTREELYETVWGRSYRKSDRSVDVYVGRLRSKLEPSAAGAPLHPHAHGHRLPVLAAGLRRVARSRARFTSFLQAGPHERNKLRREPLQGRGQQGSEGGEPSSRRPFSKTKKERLNE